MFSEVWFVDFEYFAPRGELPLPLCVVAYEMRTGRWVRLSRHELPSKPPYSVARDSLFVSFAVDAELLCHYVLGWPFPENVIDLHVEYLNYSNYLERSGKMSERATGNNVLARSEPAKGLGESPPDTVFIELWTARVDKSRP